MAFTSYVVDNDRRFRDAIKRASAVVDDLRIPFGLILADFYRSEQAIFALKSAGQFPEISPKYAKAKQKAVGFIYPLLVRTGKLSASVLGPNNPGSIANVAPLSLIFGTSITSSKGVFYPVFHQSDEPRKKIPLRKFLFIGPEASQFATSDQMGRTERWLNIMNDFVLKRMKAELA